MTFSSELWRWLSAHPGWALGVFMAGGSSGVLVMAILAVSGEERQPEPLSPVAERMDRMTAPRPVRTSTAIEPEVEDLGV